MALIQFEDLPSTNTPLNAANLNNNFNEVNKMKIMPSATNFEEFKAWLISDDASTGNFMCFLNFNGVVSSALVAKASNNYLSFIHFSYGITATQYKYFNGTWSEEELGDVTEWQSLTLANNWTAYTEDEYEKPQCGKNKNKVVLKGLLKGGTAGVGFTTLPQGYRPSKTLYFPCATDNGATYIRINSDGVCIVYSYQNWISLSGIEFYID